MWGLSVKGKKKGSQREITNNCWNRSTGKEGGGKDVGGVYHMGGKFVFGPGKGGT